ncbi:HEAT repeat domain-containing protein [Streptomyces sp. NBC_00555]|uniref:HEAT repeat domain-containing protein n=1 Tax=Streptomyces sp. NBC_00555 TaxID=2903662 RepID=UPI002254B200|nr:HEAT repeat domain-containing protein [Streptomyces sp. NBC_00555]MCX5016449.1 HEAT repeat domain-containing protein [Streptomyces sp. NBC_00555]
MSARRERAIRAGHASADRLMDGGHPGHTPVPLPEGAAETWIAFDQAVRDIHRFRYGTAYNGADVVALCHPDGYVREGALRGPDPVLELVAIRCTDWVPAVREQARRVLRAVLDADPAGTVRRLTPLLLRLGRREHGAWALELLPAALRGERLRAELRGSPDLPTRRFAARLSLESGEFGGRELARLAAAELDPQTSQLWADAALAAMAADGPDDEAFDSLVGAHLPMVRATGVTALRGAGRAAAAGKHLTDRSGLVRACARWVVRQDGGDPYAHYRELVEDPGSITPYAVTGFAECARRGDAPLLRALLAHPGNAVRAAAVGGLRLLDVTDHELLRPLLDDPSAAVAREASLSLRATAGRLPTDWLLARIAPDRPAHTRRAAYRLLHAQGGVAGLRASVELLTDGDPVLRRIAAQHIQSIWSPYRPLALPARDPEVGALLDRCTGLFSDWVLRQMRSRLGLPPGKSTTDGY